MKGRGEEGREERIFWIDGFIQFCLNIIICFYFLYHYIYMVSNQHKQYINNGYI